MKINSIYLLEEILDINGNEKSVVIILASQNKDTLLKKRNEIVKEDHTGIISNYGLLQDTEMSLISDKNKNGDTIEYNIYSVPLK